MPFGLFVDALEDVLAEAAPRRLARLADGDAAGVETVFPALDRASAPDGFRAHRAIRALLGRLAADRPLVLIPCRHACFRDGGERGHPAVAVLEAARFGEAW